MRIIAPTHGNPMTNNIGAYVEMLKETNISLCGGTPRAIKIKSSF